MENYYRNAERNFLERFGKKNSSSNRLITKRPLSILNNPKPSPFGKDNIDPTHRGSDTSEPKVEEMQALTQGKDIRRKLQSSQQSKMMNLIKNQNLLRTDWFPMTRDTIFLTCLLPSLYEMARTGSSSVNSAI